MALTINDKIVGDEHATLLRGRCENDRWATAVSFTSACTHYPYDQPLPFVAHLIPSNRPDGRSLMIEYTIEVVIGRPWTRGASNGTSVIPGRVEAGRVALGTKGPKTTQGSIR